MTVHMMPNCAGVARAAAEVRAELGRQKITVNRLPHLLGKSQSYWSRRVNGEQPMDVDDLSALASLMKVPVTRFFGTPESPRPDAPDEGSQNGHVTRQYGDNRYLSLAA